MNEEVRNELKELIAEFRGKRDMFSRTLSECSARNLSIISAQLAAFVANHEDAILAERPNDGPLMTEYLRWLNNAQVNPPKGE